MGAGGWSRRRLRVALGAGGVTLRPRSAESGRSEGAVSDRQGRSHGVASSPWGKQENEGLKSMTRKRAG